jgi:Fe-S cluster assembly protein SufD
MSEALRPAVPGSMSNAAYEQRLRDAIMDAAPRLNGKLLPVSVRGAAINNAVAAGLPALRDDLWRHADLRFMATAALAPAAALDAAAITSLEIRLPKRLPDFTRLVFINGRHAPTLSDAAAALDVSAPPLVPDRTRHERFGWLNDAFNTDVARLRVTDNLNLEIVFMNCAGSAAHTSYPRLEVQLAANTKLTLVERHLGETGEHGVVNSATQVHAGADSQCTHLRWQTFSAESQFLDTTQIALDRGARYNLALVQTGARSARSSLRVSLFGEGAHLDLHAVSVANDRRTIDTSILVDHLAPRTSNEQVLRALARQRAHLAFRSRVEVATTAVDAQSEQSLKGLMTEVGAEIDLRPQLEIHTDRVRASHGATTGALDENQRFYLLSRGLDADTARALLEWAFLEDAIRGIREPALRRAVELSLIAALDSRIALQAVK